MIHSIPYDLTNWLQGYIQQKDNCYKQAAKGLLAVLPNIRTTNQLLYHLSLDHIPDVSHFLKRKTHQDGFLTKLEKTINKVNQINALIVIAKSMITKLPTVLDPEAQTMKDMLSQVLNEEQCHLHTKIKLLLEKIVAESILEKIIPTLTYKESVGLHSEVLIETQRNNDAARFLELLCEIDCNTRGYLKNEQGEYVSVEEHVKRKQPQPESQVCIIS